MARARLFRRQVMLPLVALVVVLAAIAGLVAYGRGGSNPLAGAPASPPRASTPAPAAAAASSAGPAPRTPLPAGSPSGAATSPKRDCPAVAAFGFRGSGEADAQDPSSNGWSGPVLTAVVERARQLRFADGADFSLVPVQGVDYQAISPSNFLTFTVGLTGSVQDGITKGLAAVAAEVAGCQGKTHAVLMGYSQGAMVARAVAQQAPAGTVGGVFLLGDPEQKPYADGVQGAGSAGSGIVRTLFGTSTDSYYALPIARVSVCHGGDPVCQFSPAAVASPAGGQAHSSYGSTPAELTVLATDLANVARRAAGFAAGTPS